MKKILIFALAAIVAVSCSKQEEGGSEGGEQQPSITITNRDHRIYEIGETIDFDAQVVPADSKDEIVWRVTEGSQNIVLLSIDEDGRHAVFSAVKEGYGGVSASLGKVESNSVPVYTKEKTIPVEQVILNFTDAKVAQDDVIRLSFTTVPEDADYQSSDILWEYNESSDCFSFLEDDEDLIVEAVYWGREEEVTLTVCGQSATCKLEAVQKTIDATGIVVTSPQGNSMQEFTTMNILATVKPTNASNKDVTWTISDESVLKIQSIEDGKVSVFALKHGKARVTATHSLSGFEDSIEITVNEMPVPSGAIDLGCRVDGIPIYYSYKLLDGWYAFGDASASKSLEKVSYGFFWSNCPYTVYDQDTKQYTFTKYNATDGKSLLDATDDAASVQKIDAGWRTASVNNLRWLLDNCQITAGNEGLTFTSTIEGFTDKSITLSIYKGWYDGTENKGCGELVYVGDGWSQFHYSCVLMAATPSGNSKMICLLYDNMVNDCKVHFSLKDRYMGVSVLPVWSFIRY